MLAEPYSVQQRGALNLKVQTYKNMELFIKVDEYSQISCTQPGLYSTLLSFPTPPRAKKRAKSLGKVATYESRQAATAITSDTSGPGCLKGG